MEYVVGNRIPRKFFITRGSGQSDIMQHAGAYHFALQQAKIEMCNIMTYSSILPKIADEVDIKNVPQLVHGSVMECIMAIGHCGYKENTAAGIAYVWLYDKKTKEKFGGIVCEYSEDTSDEHKIQTKLIAAMHELYDTNYSKQYIMGKQINVVTNSLHSNKLFGTTLVALCFFDYVVPILEK